MIASRETLLRRAEGVRTAYAKRDELYSGEMDALLLAYDTISYLRNIDTYDMIHEDCKEEENERLETAM